MTPTAIAAGSALYPYKELISLETLYAEDGMTLRKVTEATVRSGLLPSEALADAVGMVPDEDVIAKVKALIEPKLGTFGVAVNNTPPHWPRKLEDSERPTPIIYYRGDIGLMEARSVSVVGARKASAEALARARRLAGELAEAGVPVVTGLARGIDTAATEEAIARGGRVIGVIGTPIDEAYPRENAGLQDAVARDHLLVSQVPFYRYSTEPFEDHRMHFPERNELMAAISDATVIVEASDTSGTLAQARACLHQGRPLFIMRSLAENHDVTWTGRFLGRDGVQVLDDASQVLDAITLRTSRRMAIGGEAG